MFISTKTYDHNEGLSCAFRQWRANSHCNMIHGYAIHVRFVFEADSLDHKNWVVDFGGLKQIKEWLKHNFDHTLAVAQDDPELDTFKMLHEKNLVDLRILPAVGCEAFSKFIFDHVNEKIMQESGGRCRVRSVEVREHAANSAMYEGAELDYARVMRNINDNGVGEVS